MALPLTLALPLVALRVLCAAIHGEVCAELLFRGAAISGCCYFGGQESCCSRTRALLPWTSPPAPPAPAPSLSMLRCAP
eukprot:2978906-Rhodomonas_salina.2